MRMSPLSGDHAQKGIALHRPSQGEPLPSVAAQLAKQLDTLNIFDTFCDQIESPRIL